MKKVLWFSRHKMSQEQRAALGECEIVQVDKSINTAYELIDEIEAADVIAIVAPLWLQEQFLRAAGDKPVIVAVNDRILTQNPDGNEDKYDFKFVRWVRLKEIKVIVEPYNA